MKVVLLAGGYGTRISEETSLKPKPMVEIGGKPILWHIMKMYSHYGFNEFVILLGYKGYYIKEYFANYFLHQSNVTIDLKTNNIEVHNNASEPWKVTLVETGLDSMTGSRVKKAQKYTNNELGWDAKWNLDETFRKTVSWYKEFYENKNIDSIKQLDEYIKE